MTTLRQQIRDYFDARVLADGKAGAILRAGAAAAAEGEIAGGSKVVRFPRWPRLFALAAALLLFAGLAVWFVPPRAESVSFAMLAPRVVEFFGAGPELPKVSQDKGALREWLLAQGAPAEFAVPAKLMPLESYGCGVVDVRGRPAYLTCFWREKKADGSGGELIHLLAVRRGDFRDSPGGAPQMREVDGWSFASWTEGEVTYTLAAAAPMEKVRAFLAQRAGGHGATVLARVSF
jgi:hypothetical protein